MNVIILVLINSNLSLLVIILIIIILVKLIIVIVTMIKIVARSPGQGHPHPRHPEQDHRAQEGPRQRQEALCPLDFSTLPYIILSYDIILLCYIDIHTVL